MRRRLTPRTLAALIAAVLAAGGGVVSHALGAWPRLENDTIDMRFGVHGADRTRPGVVVVAIDDRTFSDLHQQWPFRRKLDADVINQLRADGARAIAYDVQFTEPTDPGDDMALFTAVARARHVVLATTEVNAAGQTDVLGGAANLRQAHAVAAAANLPADAGGVIRRYPETMLGLPSFAVAAAQVAGDPCRADALPARFGAHRFPRSPGHDPHGLVLRRRLGPRRSAGVRRQDRRRRRLGPHPPGRPSDLDHRGGPDGRSRGPGQRHLDRDARQSRCGRRRDGRRWRPSCCARSSRR